MKFENKKYKFFVISDVHGEYYDMLAALDEAGFDANNADHVLVTLGDMFDRGPNSADVFTFIQSLLRGRYKAHCINIKGNHDCFLQEYLEKGMDGEFVLFNILHNGLADTIESFGGMSRNALSYTQLEDIREGIMACYRNLLPYLQQLPLYFETKNNIMVHAGIDPACKENWQLTSKDYMLWDINDSAKIIPEVRKTVIFGHHHAFRVKSLVLEEQYGKSQNLAEHLLEVNTLNGTIIRYKAYGNTDDNAALAIWKQGCKGVKIALDGCTNLTHKVNVLVFEDYFKDEDIIKDEPEGAPEEGKVKVGEATWIDNDGIYTTCGPSSTITINANPAYNHVYTGWTNN